MVCGHARASCRCAGILQVSVMTALILDSPCASGGGPPQVIDRSLMIAAPRRQWKQQGRPYRARRNRNRIRIRAAYGVSTRAPGSTGTRCVHDLEMNHRRTPSPARKSGLMSWQAGQYHYCMRHGSGGKGPRWSAQQHACGPMPIQVAKAAANSCQCRGFCHHRHPCPKRNRNRPENRPAATFRPRRTPGTPSASASCRWRPGLRQNGPAPRQATTIAIRRPRAPFGFYLAVEGTVVVVSFRVAKDKACTEGDGINICAPRAHRFLRAKITGVLWPMPARKFRGFGRLLLSKHDGAA